MRISVGSKNPVKLEAVKQAFRLLLPNETFEIIGVETDSGVSEQPMNDQETLQGAINRARAAQEATQADYGVGIEGGQSRVTDTWFTGTAAAVVGADGRIGMAFGPRIETPRETLQHVINKTNLSDAVAKSHGVENIGKKQGLFGLLTKGLITRASSSRDAVVAALASLLT